MKGIRQFVLVALLLAAVPALATGASTSATFTQRLQHVEHQWAHIDYQLPKAQRDQAFATLEKQAAALAATYPDRAEPKIWQAIVLSTRAGVHGGFGALSMVKHARKLLLAAEKIDPTALNGSIYTSLGSLYDQVPGWPLGFGSTDKARVMLRKALAINPDGIDPNYFYADFLHHHGHDHKALLALQKALKAPPRPGRALADQGRRAEIRKLIATIQSQH